ncbi:hypothetical protein TGME49_222030 [Toxoplasma gondii ME49]|uniref:DOT1 domain-containing protein n=2 Tax=Toxoplasma gondii TaxID=5811 RepID=S8FE48_TOXGM|nr:hypothetical protein TGME49_222030 [Toxoplasma gondii ME49]EPT32038.1 hypothetical protein TGME49_222030 [Toxoplasma gondii ME49]KYF42612.1 hypothetical protein TGARI_222030 [Toxoplasma gondii ARI]|eukprot:XP_002370022.2 hypothetical protein TGME49_222030 [Toxoplasma gondii ME49]
MLNPYERLRQMRKERVTVVLVCSAPVGAFLPRRNLPFFCAIEKAPDRSLSALSRVSTKTGCLDDEFLAPRSRHQRRTKNHGSDLLVAHSVPVWCACMSGFSQQERRPLADFSRGFSSEFKDCLSALSPKADFFVCRCLLLSFRAAVRVSVLSPLKRRFSCAPRIGGWRLFLRPPRSFIPLLLWMQSLRFARVTKSPFLSSITELKENASTIASVCKHSLHTGSLSEDTREGGLFCPAGFPSPFRAAAGLSLSFTLCTHNLFDSELDSCDKRQSLSVVHIRPRPLFPYLPSIRSAEPTVYWTPTSPNRRCSPLRRFALTCASVSYPFSYSRSDLLFSSRAPVLSHLCEAVSPSVAELPSMPFCARRLRSVPGASARSASEASLFPISSKVPRPEVESSETQGSQASPDSLVGPSPAGPRAEGETCAMDFYSDYFLKDTRGDSDAPETCVSVQPPHLCRGRRTSRSKAPGSSRTSTPRIRCEEGRSPSPLRSRNHASGDGSSREMNPVAAAEAAAVRERVAEEMGEIAEAAGRLFDLGGEHRERATAFLYRGCAAQVATSTAGMYGEMVESSVRQVVQYMRHYGGDEFSVFLDLGSGRGAPSCIALYQQPWLACLGIEKCPQAYSLSLETHWTVLRREMMQAELIAPPPRFPSVLCASQRCASEADGAHTADDSGEATAQKQASRWTSGALCGRGRPGGRVPERRLCFTQEDLSAFYHLEGVTHVYSFDAAMEGALINWIVQMFMRTKTWYLYASFRSDLISKFELKGASLVGQVSSSMWVSSEGRTTYIYVKDDWRTCKAYHRRWLSQFLFSSSVSSKTPTGEAGAPGVSKPEASGAAVGFQEEQNLAAKVLQMTAAETFRLLCVQQEAMWDEFENRDRTPSRSRCPLQAQRECDASLRSPSSPSPASETRSRGRSTSRRRASSVSGASRHLQLQTLQLQAASHCCAEDRLPDCLRVHGRIWATEQDLEEKEPRDVERREAVPRDTKGEFSTSEENEEKLLRHAVKTFRASFVRMSKWLQPLTVLDMLRLAFLPGEGQEAWLEQRQQQLTGGGVLTRTRRPTARGFDEQERRKEELERDGLLEMLAKAENPQEAAMCRRNLELKLETTRRDRYSIFPFSLLQDSELSPELLTRVNEDAQAVAESLAHLLSSPSPRTSSVSPLSSPLSARRHSAVAPVSVQRKSQGLPVSPQKRDLRVRVVDAAQTVSPCRPRFSAQPNTLGEWNCQDSNMEDVEQSVSFLGGSQPSVMPSFDSTPRRRSRRSSPHKELTSCRRKSELSPQISSRKEKNEHTPSPPLKRRGAGNPEESKAMISDPASSRMTPKTRAAYKLMELGFDALEIRTALSRRKRRMPEGLDN